MLDLSCKLAIMLGKRNGYISLSASQTASRFVLVSLQGKDCAETTTKTASDLMWGFHDYWGMGHAGEQEPPGDLEFLEILYAILSVRLTTTRSCQYRLC